MNGPEQVMQLFQGAQASAVLAAAIDLGVFGAIDEGDETAARIAAAVKAPERSTATLLDALAVLGLLTKKEGSYALSELAAAHLVPGKPMYMGDVAGIFANPIMWNGMAHLADAVRSGGTVLPEHAETPKHPFWESFARSSAPIAMPSAMTMAETLGPWMKGKAKVRALDVACGSGLYGLTLAKSPNVDVTLLDWPNVLVETKKWVERSGADASRVHYKEGDLFEVDFGGPYDVIVMSHIFHHFDDATCARLMKKAAAALAPGGRIVVNDFLFDASLSNPMAAMFRVTMLVWTKKGTAYEESDYRRWMKDAGLEVALVKPNVGLPSSFVIAEKR